MTNPMANPDPVPQRFAEVPGEIPASREGGAAVSPTGVTEEDVLEALRDVIDPELGINIVDLGLVYGVAFDEDGGVTLDMTLTSAACPLTDVIENQAQMILSSMVKDTRVNWVWMPPWGPDRITEDGREQLRALGFNV
ncbi:MAG: metal-sulfur cluster assembly factor [Actinomycetaceae bacterium]|nr:metal-sulfur cluster assembly factor [Actinomycetaceae bacterium]MDU0969606.1 metal-sulfur cluster assembly factor [Actinomycetaceae bacterium]